MRKKSEPFCTICMRKYETDENLLTEHLKRHLDEFSQPRHLCSECNVVFVFKTDLDRHRSAACHEEEYDGDNSDGGNSDGGEDCSDNAMPEHLTALRSGLRGPESSGPDIWAPRGPGKPAVFRCVPLWILFSTSATLRRSSSIA